MTINTEDGRFGLDCWEDPESEAEADQVLFSDDEAELRAEATRLIAGGRFKYLVLSRWDEATDEWTELDEFAA